MRFITLCISYSLQQIVRIKIFKQLCLSLLALDEDDWGKLKRFLKYLNGTRHLKLMLCTDQMKFAMHWYVDGSQQVHEDCRGQTGSLVSFGKGSVASSSNKMKCNTKSSMDMELISLVDKLMDIIWMRYFVETT